MTDIAPYQIQRVPKNGLIIISPTGAIQASATNFTEDIGRMLCVPGAGLGVTFDISWFHIPTVFNAFRTTIGRYAYIMISGEVRKVRRVAAPTEEDPEAIEDQFLDTIHDLPDEIMAIAQCFMANAARTYLRPIIWRHQAIEDHE